MWKRILWTWRKLSGARLLLGAHEWRGGKMLPSRNGILIENLKITNVENFFNFWTNSFYDGLKDNEISCFEEGGYCDSKTSSTCVSGNLNENLCSDTERACCMNGLLTTTTTTKTKTTTTTTTTTITTNTIGTTTQSTSDAPSHCPELPSNVKSCIQNCLGSPWEIIKLVNCKKIQSNRPFIREI